MIGDMERFEAAFLTSRVVFGPGTVRGVGDEVAALGASRVLFVCTPSLAGSRHAAAVRAALGAALAAEFTGVAPHVPASAVEEAAALARDCGAGAVVALGGGSAVGLAKMVSLRTGGMPVVAVPATYAGSEVTPVAGTSDPAARRKTVVRDPRLLPAVAIYDPEVTLDLPPQLTASTGINALAHSVEAVYSPSAPPFVPPVALDAAARIRRALPRCVTAGSDLAARTEMLLAAYLAAFSLAHAGMGVHHGVCHVLGGRFRIPHGVANAIVLPHAMRFNADAVAPALARVAAALEAPDAAGAVASLVAGLGLPTRLRDVGVPEAELPAAAEEALGSAAVRANPKPVTRPEQVLSILRAAW